MNRHRGLGRGHAEFFGDPLQRFTSRTRSFDDETRGQKRFLDISSLIIFEIVRLRCRRCVREQTLSSRGESSLSLYRALFRRGDFSVLHVHVLTTILERRLVAKKTDKESTSLRSA